MKNPLMNSLGYEYQSPFVRQLVLREEGCRMQGHAAGRVEMLLKLLTLRFGPLTPEIQTRVSGAPEAELDALAERVLTAQTLEEAVNVLS